MQELALCCGRSRVFAACAIEEIRELAEICCVAPRVFDVIPHGFHDQVSGYKYIYIYICWAGLLGFFGDVRVVFVGWFYIIIWEIWVKGKGVRLYLFKLII